MAVAWMIACIVVDFFVIIANIMEQILIFKKWSFLDRIDHLLLSLSISDLINGISMMGIDTWALSTLNDENEMSSTFNIFATIIDGVFLFSIFASIFHVIAVAIERLYAIKFPRKYYIFTTFKLKCATIAIIWISSISLTILFSLITGFSNESNVDSYVRASVFGISALIVFITYTYIAYLLIRQRQTILQNFSPDYGMQENRLKRLTVLCLFIGISFVICILPITLSYFDERYYHYFANLMVTLNSLINPCVYFVKVYYESKKITRNRSDTTNALLDTRSCTVTTDINDDTDFNKNDDQLRGSQRFA